MVINGLKTGNLPLSAGNPTAEKHGFSYEQAWGTLKKEKHIHKQQSIAFKVTREEQQ